MNYPSYPCAFPQSKLTLTFASRYGMRNRATVFAENDFDLHSWVYDDCILFRMSESYGIHLQWGSFSAKWAKPKYTLNCLFWYAPQIRVVPVRCAAE